MLVTHHDLKPDNVIPDVPVDGVLPPALAHQIGEEAEARAFWEEQLRMCWCGACPVSPPYLAPLPHLAGAELLRVDA